MDVRLGFAEFDTLAAPYEVRIGWAEFDTQAAPFGVYLGWCEFDNRSGGEAVPRYIGGGGGYLAGGQTVSRYHSEKNRNYMVPVELPAGADEAEEEEVIMALLMEIAARELV